jgi:hypothetical protein
MATGRFLSRSIALCEQLVDLDDDVQRTEVEDAMNTLEQVIATTFTPLDEERRRRFELDRERQRLRDWWSSVAAQLPNWHYAHFGNGEWRDKVSSVAIAAVRRWDPLGGAGLVVCGPTGSGKSSAIVARLRETLVELGNKLQATGDGPRLSRVLWTTEEALMRNAYRWESDDDTVAWTFARACATKDRGARSGHSSVSRTPDPISTDPHDRQQASRYAHRRASLSSALVLIQNRRRATAEPSWLRRPALEMSTSRNQRGRLSSHSTSLLFVSVTSTPRRTPPAARCEKRAAARR